MVVFQIDFNPVVVKRVLSETWLIYETDFRIDTILP